MWLAEHFSQVLCLPLVCLVGFQPSNFHSESSLLVAAPHQNVFCLLFWSIQTGPLPPW
jgi:hypothetical protein